METTFEHIILLLQKRPLMLIGEYNIYYLRYFINGYFHGRNIDKQSSAEKDFSDNFDDWIHEYYNDRTTHDWAGLIWYWSGGHKAAIEKFIELYNEFSTRDHIPNESNI